MGMTIAEAAERSGLTSHTLRYYERDGLMLLPVERSSTGHRRYTDRDLSWIELVTRLRATGMPIRDVRRYADLVRAGAGNEQERLELLRRPPPRGAGPARRGPGPSRRHRPQDRDLRRPPRARPGLTSSALEALT